MLQITRKDWEDKKNETEMQIKNLEMSLMGYKALLTLCSEKLRDFPIEENKEELEAEKTISDAIKSMVT